MKTSFHQVLLAFALLTFFSSEIALAQQSVSEEGKRKIKTRVNPHYPELIRNMGIGGKVKLQLVIAADGHVKTATGLGGHPVLVQACLDAVKDWKYEPGPSETTQVIEIEFAPPH